MQDQRKGSLIVFGAFVICSTTFAQQPAKMIGDYQGFSVGSYSAWIAPFNRGALVSGKDYTESITAVPDTFPNNTILTWKWPHTLASSIYEFISIQFGNYWDTFPLVPVPAKTVDEIKSLTVACDTTIVGQLQGFDVIIDLFLTRKPGDASTHAFEIEVFLHSPANSIAYASSATPIGEMWASGRNWNMSIDKNRNDILIIPADHSDVLSTPIDLKAMITYLVLHDVVSPGLYFNGYSFGIETTQDGGSLTIRSLSTIYQ